MTALNGTLSFHGRPQTRMSGVTLLVALTASTVLAVAMALALQASPPSVLVVAGGVFLIGSLALALGRYDAAVALGIFLLAAVRVEPAPPDVVLGVAIAVAFVTGRFVVDRVPRTALVLVGLFLVTNLLAGVAVADASRAGSFFATTLYLCIFALWLPSYVTSAARARLVVRAYLGAAAVSAAIALAALALPIPARSILVEGSRAQALFKDPNVFGPFLIPAALIVGEELVTPRFLRVRGLFKLALFLLLSLGVLFSYSRAAWLNYVVGVTVVLAVLLLRRGGAKRALKLVLVLAVAGATLAAVVSATQSAAFLDQRAGFQAYDVERFDAQRLGLNLAETYPLGIGPGQFEAYASLSAHSTFVRALAEEGVLGFVALSLLLLVTLYWAAGNALRGGRADRIGSAALLGAWCGLLANSFFIDTVHWRHLWLVAGLIWAATPHIGNRAAASRRLEE